MQGSEKFTQENSRMLPPPAPQAQGTAALLEQPCTRERAAAAQVSVADSASRAAWGRLSDRPGLRRCGSAALRAQRAAAPRGQRGSWRRRQPKQQHCGTRRRRAVGQRTASSCYQSPASLTLERARRSVRESEVRRGGVSAPSERQFAAARAGEHPRHVRAPRPELLRQRGQRDQLRPGRWRQQQPRSPGGVGAPGRDAGACGNTQRISSRGRLSDRL